MTFIEFLTEYNGLANVGNTPENMGECVGLVNKWVENLNLPHIWGHARDLFANADDRFFDKILNTPDAVPQQGDIIVWVFGTYGHTAIATGGAGTDLHKFEVFEQNVPLKGPCRLHVYNNEYKDVVGWLRPKVTQLDSQKIIIQQSDAFIAICTKLNTPANREVVLAELDKLITMQDKLIEKDKQLNEAHTQALELEKTITLKEGELKTLQDTLKVLTNEVQAAVEENKIMSGEIDQLKKDCQPQVSFQGWKQIIFEILKKL